MICTNCGQPWPPATIETMYSNPCPCGASEECQSDDQPKTEDVGEQPQVNKIKAIPLDHLFGPGEEPDPAPGSPTQGLTADDLIGISALALIHAQKQVAELRAEVEEGTEIEEAALEAINDTIHPESDPPNVKKARGILMRAYCAPADSPPPAEAPSAGYVAGLKEALESIKSTAKKALNPLDRTLVSDYDFGAIIEGLGRTAGLALEALPDREAEPAYAAEDVARLVYWAMLVVDHMVRYVGQDPSDAGPWWRTAGEKTRDKLGRAILPLEHLLTNELNPEGFAPFAKEEGEQR